MGHGLAPEEEVQGVAVWNPWGPPDLRLVCDQSVPEVLFQIHQMHGGGTAGGAILHEPYSSLVFDKWQDMFF